MMTPILPTYLFSYDKHTRRFVTEASTAFDDCPGVPTKFEIISPKTNTKVPFVMTKGLRQDGEVYGWQYDFDRAAAADKPDLWDLVAIVYND
jgi:hypothetical protein